MKILKWEIIPFLGAKNCQTRCSIYSVERSGGKALFSRFSRREHSMSLEPSVPSSLTQIKYVPAGLVHYIYKCYPRAGRQDDAASRLMLIGIVVPLKAKQVSNKWCVTCENLKLTLSSVMAQTDGNFKCLVVGHDEPEFFDNLKCQHCVSFASVDNLVPPQPGTDEVKNQLLYEADRCVKILTGMVALKRRHPCIDYWYVLDADDLIRNDFVQRMQEYDGVDAIILDSGYSFYANRQIYNREDKLSQYCGSTVVLSERLCKVSTSVSALDYRSVPFGNISHVYMRDELINMNYSVAIPDERLVMYVRDHGENISNLAYYNTRWRKLKKSIKARVNSFRISSDLNKRFGMDV